MERRKMGEYTRRAPYGVETSDRRGRGLDDRRPQNLDAFMEGGKATRFRQVHDGPRPGERYGRLVILRELPKRQGHRQLLAQCDCGAMPGRVGYDNVRRGKTSQCNLCAIEATKRYRKQYFCYDDAMPDDAHRTRLLNRLSAAISRTTNPRAKGYKNYGSRGIAVCDEWKRDKRSFLLYVQTLDGWDNPDFEMDRIDTDGNYEPGNLRFVSRSENCRNRRSVPELQRKYDEALTRIAELEREVNLLRAGLRPD
ncbi:HNH endonuclease [Sodalis phage SO-1]|uniref:Gp39 n=1 Tax=Sodalis phage SO-1 TaxID=673375 RepID=C9EHC9_9CAUD|nr:HNH endonuclease [Sodalis phage SO1]ACV84131.1 gp39 [Sodalis phage SO1]